MYRASSSYRMRTSVRSLAGEPSLGCTWVSSVMGVAEAQPASLSTPSTRIADVTRAADAPGACRSWTYSEGRWPGVGVGAGETGSCAMAGDARTVVRASKVPTRTIGWKSRSIMGGMTGKDSSGRLTIRPYAERESLIQGFDLTVRRGTDIF